MCKNEHNFIDAVLADRQVELWYDMSSVCHLSVRNACIVAKRYVVRNRRWYSWIGRWQLFIHCQK